MPNNDLSIFDELDHFFEDDFFRNPVPSVFSGTGLIQYPQVNISSTDSELKVRATIPGLDPQKVKIEVTEDTLSLSGEYIDEHEELGENFLQRECYQGTFSRTFHLPEEIDPEGVDAIASEGILTIVMPKAHPVEPPVKQTASKKKAPTKKATPKKKAPTKKATPKKKAASKKKAPAKKKK